MTQDAKSWPSEPGLPLHPDKSGYHWLSWQGGPPVPWEYDAELNPYGNWRTDEGNLGAWIYHEPQRYGRSGMKTPNSMVAEGWRYLGPCLPPDTANALIKALKDLIPEAINDRYMTQSYAVEQARAAIAKATGGQP